MKKTDSLYLRVGTQYFKKVKKPLSSGDFNEILIPWSYSNIKSDLSDEERAEIAKYDGFCVIPNNLDFKQMVGSFYNKYMPVEHVPSEGSYEKIFFFLKHIFQEQIELGLDYLKILYEHPMQRLPVLCLVSNDRNTGKSTFLFLLKAIFDGNMTINTNDDFRSNFNSEWAEKLIIGVDETFLDKKEDSERIKNLSTTKFYKYEAKGKDRFEIEFFGKFILCSNNEDSFIYIDSNEIRYWVIKVPTFNAENKNLLAEMKTEIPAFLHFLLKRPFHTKNESRMWFRPDLIMTDALKKLKKHNKSKLEQELMYLICIFFDGESIAEIDFTLSDAFLWLRSAGMSRFEPKFVKSIFIDKWGLHPKENSLSYNRYWLDSEGRICKESAKGRYFTLNFEDLKKIDE